jgi:hypothetical protein
MKPARSPTTTGDFPRAVTSRSTARTTSASETTVLTTSTKLCTGAGLKKCSPTTRPGWDDDAAIEVTDNDEVFVARTASAATTVSSRRKTSCLTSSLSTTASITSPQEATSSRDVV